MKQNRESDIKESSKSKSILPFKWRIAFALSFGALAGLLLAILTLSRAFSYLSDEPEACVNCHVMTPQYATWLHSSHREQTVCNDCHVPHDSFIRKYWFKANDGLRHATVFTFGDIPQVIHIKEAGIAVVQENCIRCHKDQIHPVSIVHDTYEKYKSGEGKLCWDCHRHIPHGRVSSQSSTPYAKVPKLGIALPQWLKTDEKK